MTAQEYRQAVYKLAKIAADRDRWGPELFKSLQRSCYEGLCHEREPCVFNILRGTMEESEYNELDLAYFCHFMPDAKEDHIYAQKMIERKNESDCLKKRQDLLLIKKQLLRQQLKLLKQSLQRQTEN